MQLYEPSAVGINPTAESDLPLSFISRLEKELKRVIQSLWDGDKIKTDSRLVSLVGQTVTDAMEVGYGNTLGEVDFTTPDGEMLQRLTRDVWQFSAAKNYQQMRDMTLALHDANGKLRSFNEFEEAARVINSQYNRTWLKTEYNQAVGSATMAARWADFKKNADIMPYLQYQTVGDDNVRHEHRLLDGIIRKISDPFWATHYPPNGWGCRCDVVQLAASSAHETENDRIPKVPIPEMFRTNLADAGLIFPKGHPYYNGVTITILRQAVASLPESVAYTTVYKSEATGKTVDLHFMHGINETANNIKTAKILADKGHDVKLLPVLGQSDDHIRELIYGTKEFVPGRNPDALVDKVLFDFKNSQKATKSAIHNAIREANEQADKCVIRLPESLSDVDIYRFVKGKMKQTGFINEAWVINADNQISKFTLSDWGLTQKAKRPTR